MFGPSDQAVALQVEPGWIDLPRLQVKMPQAKLEFKKAEPESKGAKLDIGALFKREQVRFKQEPKHDDQKPVQVKQEPSDDNDQRPVQAKCEVHLPPGKRQRMVPPPQLKPTKRMHPCSESTRCYHCQHPKWKRRCLGPNGTSNDAYNDFVERTKRQQKQRGLRGAHKAQATTPPKVSFATRPQVLQCSPLNLRTK